MDDKQQKIREEIENILCTRFMVSQDLLCGMESADDTFFGSQCGIGPRDMTYLAYILETRFNICFGKKEYEDPRFYSLVGLSEIVTSMISIQNNNHKESL